MALEPTDLSRPAHLWLTRAGAFVGRSAAGRQYGGAVPLEVTEIHDLADLRDVCALFNAIWGREDNPPVVPELLRALSHAGGYVAGGRIDGRLVAGSVAFVGFDQSGLLLHSHITGVEPGCQSQGIGVEIKRHQQRWCAERGIPTITWTFDPLVRRNGRFNLTTLGAEAVAYLPDFYGVMVDTINRDDPTDRCVARWSVDATRRAEPDFDALIEHGAEVVLKVGADGGPQLSASRADIRLAQVPDDIVALRERDSSLSLAWRMACRDAMTTAFDDGLIAVAADRDGWWVFAKEPPGEPSAG